MYVKNLKLLLLRLLVLNHLLKDDWLKKGMHITAMGSDAEHKNELDPMIIKSCDLYIPDKQSQTNVLGELHHAIKKELVRRIMTKFIELGKCNKKS